MKTKTKNSEFIFRESSMDIEISESKGNYVYDVNGKEYLDFYMGWCVGNLGWGNREIISAIKKHKGPDYVHPGYYYQPWNDFAQSLLSLLPDNLDVCFRATGGSEAVEGALQASMIYTGRKKFLSLEESYHGNTIGALSIGDSSSEKIYGNLLRNCIKIKTPRDSKCLSRFKSYLEKKDVAAVIMEPFPCNIGVEIPEQGFMEKLEKLCRKNGTLLIIDEVATGFGRTGRMFGSEYFDINPDIICLGKGLSGGYSGIGAFATTGKILKKIKKDFSFFSTFGWHPLSVTAAAANVSIFKRDGKKILENVQKTSELFMERIGKIEFRTKTKINIIGLAISIETGDEKEVSRIEKGCKKNGLLINAAGKRINLFPALNIDKKTAEKGLDILEESIRKK